MTDTAKATVGGLEIAYEEFGSPDAPPLLLIMGLASQMLMWPDEFCRDLAATGFRVVRFDNRDCGLSTHLDAEPPIGLTGMLDRTATPPYLIGDMADDAAGLLDALGIADAHVVGMSMGGMIAQEVAIRHPGRVRTLTSIMSTPAAHIGKPTDAAMGALLAPPGADRDGAATATVALFRVVGSPGYPLDEQWLADVARRCFDRCRPDPQGTLRQLFAIWSSPDRRPALGSVTVPALVVHGADDPLVTLPGGEATAAAIPGARLLVLPGMGHDLPRQLWPEYIQAIGCVSAGSGAPHA